MPRFALLFKVQPPGVFGLSDGDRLVLPAVPGRTFEGPWLDTRTGQIASHGSLPEYRKASDALNVQLKSGSLTLSMRDNFLTLELDAATAQSAADVALHFVDTFTQALGAQHGVVFHASLLSTQDEAGRPYPVQTGPVVLSAMHCTLFDLNELSARVERAFRWAVVADSIAKKALLYFEHACMLSAHSQQLPLLSDHAAFSQALAFLQMFKALTSLLGEPGTDKDYQRRAKTLGLPPDYWFTRVKPLYTVRCDDDVAHYSHAFPKPDVYLQKFNEAAAVFIEALEAHIQTRCSARPDELT